MSEVSDLIIKHQVLLERYKSGLTKSYKRESNSLMKRIVASVQAQQIDTFDELPIKDLNRYIANLNTLQDLSHAESVAGLAKDLEKFSKADTLFEVGVLNSLLTSKVAKGPGRDAWARALNSPITANGELLEPFIRGWGETKKKQVNGIIRQGHKQGWTIQQMKQQLLGTRPANFKNGLQRKQDNQADAVIRTATQHVSATARSNVLEANKDIVSTYRWVSTLDSRTTPICQTLDGQVFPTGEGPLPPIHIGCRSTFIPEVDSDLGLDFLDEGATRSAVGGPVPADQSYYNWLKTQPREFQDKAIGKGFARILNDGTLTSQQFSDLRLDKNFKPLTLDEMVQATSRSFVQQPPQVSLTAIGRPKAGTKTAQAWDLLDKMQGGLHNPIPSKEAFLARATSESLPISAQSLGSQYGKWRKATIAEQLGGKAVVTPPKPVVIKPKPKPVVPPVVPPTPGTARPKLTPKQAQIWDSGDTLLATNNGTVPSKAEFVAFAKANGAQLSDQSIGTQYGKWKKNLTVGSTPTPTPKPIPKKTSNDFAVTRIEDRMEKFVRSGNPLTAKNLADIEVAKNELAEIISLGIDEKYLTFDVNRLSLPLQARYSDVLSQYWELTGERFDRHAPSFSGFTRTLTKTQRNTLRTDIHKMLENERRTTPALRDYNFNELPELDDYGDLVEGIGAGAKTAFLKQEPAFMKLVTEEVLEDVDKPFSIWRMKDVKKGRNRAHYNPYDNAINVGDTSYSNQSTMLHELAHQIEEARPDILDSNVKWLEKRRGIETYKGKAEPYYNDEWVSRGGNTYVSRKYTTNIGRVHATEVLSMGIERLYNDPVDFYTRDKEHFLQTIKGLLDLH